MRFTVPSGLVCVRRGSAKREAEEKSPARPYAVYNTGTVCNLSTRPEQWTGHFRSVESSPAAVAAGTLSGFVRAKLMRVSFCGPLPGRTVRFSYFSLYFIFRISARPPSRRSVLVCLRWLHVARTRIATVPAIPTSGLKAGYIDDSVVQLEIVFGHRVTESSPRCGNSVL